MGESQKIAKYFGIYYTTERSQRTRHCRLCGGFVDAGARIAHVDGQAILGRRVPDGHVKCVRRRIRAIRT